MLGDLTTILEDLLREAQTAVGTRFRQGRVWTEFSQGALRPLRSLLARNVLQADIGWSQDALPLHVLHRCHHVPPRHPAARCEGDSGRGQRRLRCVYGEGDGRFHRRSRSPACQARGCPWYERLSLR